MKIKKYPGSFVVTTCVPASEAPIMVKDEEGNDVFKFTIKHGTAGDLTSFSFTANSIVDGCLAIVTPCGDDFDVKFWTRVYAEELVAASKYEQKAKEIAEAALAEEAQAEAIIAEMLA